METIFKYPLEDKAIQKIDIPAGGKILAVQVQRGIPCLWVKVNSDNPFRTRIIETYYTGKAMKAHPDRVYVGTYQFDERNLVFHVFELL
jgi:hypothetical protein